MRIFSGVVGLAAGVVLAVAAPAAAQVCGDADGNGVISITDGVQSLRAAAGLDTTCDGGACDVDGSGAVTITDGVRILRRAAGLDTTFGCGTTTSSFVTGVLVNGQPAVLDIGAAPVPGPGAPSTVGQPEGNTNVVAGGSNEVDITFDTGGSAGIAQTGDGPTLVLSIADEQGNLFDGFFLIPLDTTAGAITVTVLFPQDLGSDPFLLCPATLRDGVLSQYAILRQDPIDVATGSVQVSLSFQPSQDLDLRLIEPTGTEIFFGNPTSAAGGMLDLDSNAGCQIDGRNNENIGYPDDVNPPEGEYIVRVGFFATCDGGGATFTVVVNNGGQQSTFQGSFSASEAGTIREVGRFTFPP